MRIKSIYMHYSLMFKHISLLITYQHHNHYAKFVLGYTPFTGIIIHLCRHCKQFCNCSVIDSCLPRQHYENQWVGFHWGGGGCLVTKQVDSF